ncbi:MarR family transcriptional regulator [Fusobacterium sp.]|uniref:MarR family transcriptional regulator n=1 Tax=Fusobacterium sp. TaxID=68766 RepID=UPI00396C59F7
MKNINKEKQELFKFMEEKINHIYKFVKLYNDYINTPRDYGNEEKFNMLSIHILTTIEENPGITVTEIATEWFRTKGGISQVIKLLEEKNYIFRKKDKKNKKIIHLFPTIKGTEASLAHKIYDIKNLNKTLSKLLEECSEEDIRSFHKVIDCYIKILTN